MDIRLRDFVKTREGYFAVNTYQHPKDKIISFLRYINIDEIGMHILKDYNLDENDIRSLEGHNYIKIAESKTAYDILKEYYPEYLFYDDVNDVLLHAIPKNRIESILSPNARLKNVLETQNTNAEKKCAKLAEILNNYGLKYENMGVSGSTVLKLNNKLSDIDFVVYGMKNHKFAREILNMAFQDNVLKPLSDEFWKKAFLKRIKDKTIGYDEFVWHEKRKLNRGVIDGVMFDLLATRDWNEINESYGEKRYKNLGFIQIKAKVADDSFIFDNPALYTLEDVEILNNENNINVTADEIKEVVSFTHTYAGSAYFGEEIVVRGKLEEVYGKKCYKRVVVGTTREAFNEYVRLKSNF
ncbi:DNA polymerase beta domain protein region [Methanococcus vannielii SB]|jgi:predicted nucleotidyltransferase|uniref:DNA polymerase beta domain protein region n=1 Tax=Methanococcus vannielii (strain ATCC 35089 / DSM 1224 / JCM 13029 / OCM 148 / SB) TaxID=406327 RepID=A6UPM8_METVS|nr:nucleotidyltransferase domain-containing protein [Methanococcus vannielii]ABR54450.1 DNA polymerase beta domain protein region [Methanococcus vannielii SB]